MPAPLPPRLAIARRLTLSPRELVPPGIELAVHDSELPPSREELLGLCRGASALVCTLADRIDPAFLDAVPTLRGVANHAVGLDNIDLAACAARGVAVSHTPGVLTEATADLAVALLLAVTRRVREGEQLVRSGQFRGWAPTMLCGLELRAATLGIFGFGRIGQATARRARAFGMKILFTSRSAAPPAVVAELSARRVPFDELLSQSDAISIHAPLTPETRHAFDAAALGRMKRGAYLINTGRGPTVDEAALAESLAAGHLRGAGLDVYEREPAVHPALLGRDDVVLLPHLGSATDQTRAQMARMVLEDAVRMLRGEAPLFPAR